MARSTRLSNSTVSKRNAANKPAANKSSNTKSLSSTKKTANHSKPQVNKAKTTTIKSFATVQKTKIVNVKSTAKNPPKIAITNTNRKSARTAAKNNKSNPTKASAKNTSSSSSTANKRFAVKVKTEKNDDFDFTQLNEVPAALQNVKTEVKVENQEYNPQIYDSLQNMSPLVHAADGRSRHNLVDGKRPFRIPPHLLGRNLNDPASDVVAGSRRPLQKPRLGVKIPYRNLTSQIITHEELTRELLERSKRKTAALDNASGNASEGSKGYFFTMKLMARLAHRLPNPHFPELSGYRPVASEATNTDNMGFMRPGCSIDPDLEREIALKQLQELPTKRKARDSVTEHVDYKKVAIKNEPLSSQQLALKQLEEIQIRKPRSEQTLSKPLHHKLKAKLKFQVKLNTVHCKAKDSGSKLQSQRLSQLRKKNINNNNKKNVNSTVSTPTSTRASAKKRNATEMSKTRFSSRLNR